MTQAVNILLNATAPGAGASKPLNAKDLTFFGVVAGTGALTGTVLIQVSNDNVNWLTLGTINLSGTTVAQDGFASSANWTFFRANVTAITGTGATINVFAGIPTS